jgi:hypothetical protein
MESETGIQMIHHRVTEDTEKPIKRKDKIDK